MEFTSFDLHRQILQACSNNGFSTPTPIQQKAIPEIIAGNDVMACAQTGTGKTGAFTLPLIHRLLHDTNNTQRGPKAVILSPTRELAEQILVSLRMFTKGTQLKTGVVVGGVAYAPQIKMLSKPLDILVATPGRLIDHFMEGRVDLTNVQTFILDEADRMLDMGFVKPVETIAETMPKNRQTLLFSATFSPAVERLAKRFLNNPTIIKLAEATAEHKNINQSLFFATGREQKKDLLKHLLSDGKVWQTVVFIKTKHQADKLAKDIKDWGHPSAALHGDMRQGARKKVIAQMHENKLKVLVATDVAARGLDIKDLTHVINFDLPQVAEDYVHRIGRTGRAGNEGTAYSIVSRDEMNLLRAIEKLIGRKIEENTQGSNASHLPKVQPTKKSAPKGGMRKTANPQVEASFAKSEKSSGPKTYLKKDKKKSQGKLGTLSTVDLVSNAETALEERTKKFSHKGKKFTKPMGQSSDQETGKKPNGKKPWEKKPWEKKEGGYKSASKGGYSKGGRSTGRPLADKFAKTKGRPSGASTSGKPSGKPGAKPWAKAGRPGGKPNFKGGPRQGAPKR